LGPASKVTIEKGGGGAIRGGGKLRMVQRNRER